MHLQGGNKGQFFYLLTGNISLTVQPSSVTSNRSHTNDVYTRSRLNLTPSKSLK